VVALECRPGRVADEDGEQKKDDGGLNPPPVLPHGLAEAATNDRELRVRHAGAFCGGKDQQGYSRKHDTLSMPKLTTERLTTETRRKRRVAPTGWLTPKPVAWINPPTNI
jgi:hypothetical protein